MSEPIPPLIPWPDGDERAAVGFDGRTLLRITRMAFVYRWRMAVAIGATVLAGVAQILIPLLIGASVDRIHAVLQAGLTDTRRGESDLVVIAAGLFLVAAFRGTVTMLQSYQGEVVGHKMANELRLAYYARLQSLSFTYHDTAHTGELMTRGILDIEGTRMWVHTGILRLFLLVVLLGGGALILARIDGPLTWVALAFVPFVAIGASLTRLKLRSLWYQLQRELGILTRIMEENLGALRLVRAYAAEAFELARFDHVSARARAITHRRIAFFVGSTTGMTLAFFLSMGLVLWIGGERVIEGRLTVGELATFLTFMAILQQPVRQISWMVNSIARASTCGARLFEILDMEPAIADAPSAVDIPDPGDGILRFENVSFGYETEGRKVPLLKNVSLEVGPGEVLGIVGPPGSGKSTLAHLISRFYDPDAGRVTLCGVDLRDLKLAALRRAVASVQQDAYLFTAPLDSNIAYAEPWFDDDALRSAAQTAQLHDHIRTLPRGYRTLVGERGVSLSGGQRQRLAIARAVLPESRVRVLDDAMAAVDAGTEQAILKALAQTAAQPATVIIAHRLSTLRGADQIVFLLDGEVAEHGTHDELLALDGRYAALYRLQTMATA
ncbi:MAG: ABC transporter ATP-binding protein [Pseudomonadota bacterium]